MQYTNKKYNIKATEYVVKLENIWSTKIHQSLFDQIFTSNFDKVYKKYFFKDFFRTSVFLSLIILSNLVTAKRQSGHFESPFTCINISMSLLLTAGQALIKGQTCDGSISCARRAINAGSYVFTKSTQVLFMESGSLAHALSITSFIFS